MPLIKKNQSVYAKIQAVAGTAEAIAAADVVRVHNVSVAPNHGIRNVERNDALGGFGADAAVFGGKMVAVTMSWRTMPCYDVSGTFTNEHTTLFRLCALAETAASAPDGADANLELAPNSTAKVFGTIVVDEDGTRWTIRDAVANALSMSVETGGVVEWTATFVGYGAQTDQTFVAQTYRGEEPFIARGATFTVDAWTGAVVKNFSIDFGVSAPDRADMTDTQGFASPLITDVMPKGNVSFERVLVATKDIEALISGGAVAMSLEIPGSGTAAFTISIAKAKFTERASGDDGGVMTEELSFEVARNAGVLDVKMKWDD